MTNKISVTVEQDGEWFIASSQEFPGANGQGRTREECLQSLAAALSLIFEDRLENDPEFLAKIQASREDLREGRGRKVEDLDWEA